MGGCREWEIERSMADVAFVLLTVALFALLGLAARAVGRL
jgi:hypothetical protein